MKTNTENKNLVASLYPKSFLESAKLSGSALKVTTAKSGGEYPITFKETGTGKVLGFLYSLVASKNGEKVPAEKIAEAFSTAEKDSFATKYGKAFNSNLPKGYGNYKTLKTRIIGEIKKGAIKIFVASDLENSFFSKVKKEISA